MNSREHVSNLYFDLIDAGELHTKSEMYRGIFDTYDGASGIPPIITVDIMFVMCIFWTCIKFRCNPQTAINTIIMNLSIPNQATPCCVMNMVG